MITTSDAVIAIKRAIFCFTTSLFLFPWLSVAQPFGDAVQSPDDLMDQFIAMFNSAQKSAVAEFVDNHVAKATLARFGDEGRSRYVGYLSGEKRFHHAFEQEITATLAPSNNKGIIRRQVRSHNTELSYTITLYTTNDAPYKATSIYVQPSNENSAPEPKISKGQFQKKLSDYVDRLAQRGVFSGTVLVAGDDGVIFKGAAGLASIRYRTKNNIDTKFNIGSMNKMFTAISIMQLVERGKLSLDDKLTEYVDRNLFSEGEFDQITIEQLLTHTSGLGRADYPELNQNSLRELNDHRPYIKHLPLTHTPGSRFQYSNDGMALLGMVIEQASGMSYYNYVRHNIYDVADMKNSDSYDVDLPISNIAMGYFYSTEFESIQSNLFLHPIKGGPAGGGFSTAPDLYNFAKALTSYKLLSKKYTEASYTAKPQINSPRYGYGFSVGGTDDNRIIGHSGSYIGASAYFRVFLDKGYTVVVLANQSFASEPVSAKIGQLIQQL